MILRILNAFLISIFFVFCCNAQKADRQPALIDNERLLIERIKQVAGWDDRGFVTRINELPGDFLAQVEAESFPERLPEEERPTFWKEVIRRFAQTYEKTQKQANSRRDLPAARWRGEMNKLFARRLALRGGGSTSAELWEYLPGQVEWILGHIDSPSGKPPTDKEWLEKTLQGYPFFIGSSDEAQSALRGILKDLHTLEDKLTPSQARFFRSEFARFFSVDYRHD